MQCFCTLSLFWYLAFTHSANRCPKDKSIYVTLTCMIASRTFVKLKRKVESRTKSISCKILPISCLAAMSKNLKYSCKFQKEWRREFDFVQPSRLGVNHVYCSFCNTDFRLTSVTVLSLVLPWQLGVSMIMMSPGIQWVRHISPTRK